MKILVTGAAGFLGRAVVNEALTRGHKVKAMIRPGSVVDDIPWHDHPMVEFTTADLRSRKDLDKAIAGVDKIVHLAASISGDFYGQFEGTVLATENLLEAIKSNGGCPFVLISSFSVYGYLKRWSLTTIDEDSPIEEVMDERDDYAKTKLLQEQLVRKYSQENNWPLVVLRPGVIYGPGKVYGARMGAKATQRFWLRFGAWASVPLTYVENCAQAVILATENEAAMGQTLNILDDNPPSQRLVVKMIRQRTTPRPFIFPISWTILRVTARLVWLVNKIFLGGKAKVPGIFIPARLHARFKPLRYSNEKVNRILKWKPRYSLDQALDKCCLEDKGDD